MLVKPGVEARPPEKPDSVRPPGFGSDKWTSLLEVPRQKTYTPILVYIYRVKTESQISLAVSRLGLSKTPQRNSPGETRTVESTPPRPQVREGEIVFGALDAKKSASSGSRVEDGPTKGPEWKGLGPECGRVFVCVCVRTCF